METDLVYMSWVEQTFLIHKHKLGFQCLYLIWLAILQQVRKSDTISFIIHYD